MSGVAKVSQRYRPGVGIILLNSKHHVWIGRRGDITSEAWQMPQGGIEEGETSEMSALRELEEETGVTSDLTEILAVSRGWYQYNLPSKLIKTAWGGRYRGQRQRWYVMRFLGNNNDINIQTEHPEFSDWRWSDPATLASYTIDFKRELYVSLIKEFKAFL